MAIDSIPHEYQLNELPSSVKRLLKPCFSRNEILNGGKCERIMLTTSKAVYFYRFLETEAASSATRESFELDHVSEYSVDLDQMLPPVPNPDIVIVIPRVFVTKIQLSAG